MERGKGDDEEKGTIEPTPIVTGVRDGYTENGEGDGFMDNRGPKVDQTKKLTKGSIQL